MGGYCGCFAGMSNVVADIAPIISEDVSPVVSSSGAESISSSTFCIHSDISTAAPWSAAELEAMEDIIINSRLMSHDL